MDGGAEADADRLLDPATLGQRLADAMDLPFVELSREIEKTAGCSIREIHDLYGSNAYRRYERRALDETLGLHAEAVIATPGGIVSEPATFNVLLSRCTTVWLQAEPEEHMARVAAQGDTRPMAASREAMEDLRQGRPHAEHQRRARGEKRRASAQDDRGAAHARHRGLKSSYA